MSKYVTVSVKVPYKLREKMRQFGIKPSTLLRRAIEDEIRRREVKSVKKEIKELKAVLDRIPMEDVVRGIREDREHR